MMRVGGISEFALIDRIRERVPCRRESLLVGIGDDGAVVRNTPGLASVIVTDLLAEGVHFDLSYTDLRRLGRKSLNINISDVLVMGGEPTVALLSVAMPAGMALDSWDEFVAGFGEAASANGVVLAGGDTSSSRHGLWISVTLMGEALEEAIVRRSGARVGDLVFVTGTLGNSAAGLNMLEARSWSAGNEHHEFLIGRHLDPRPPVDSIRTLVRQGLASSMIDISDGLSSELHHISASSGVGLHIFEKKIPVSTHLHRYTHAADIALSPLVLHGGEEYEALFTVKPEHAKQVRFLISSGDINATEIGMVHKGEGVTLTESGGRTVRLQAHGFDHFQA